MVDKKLLKKKFREYNRALEKIEDKIIQLAEFYVPKARAFAQQMGLDPETVAVDLSFEYTSGEKVIGTGLEEMLTLLFDDKESRLIGDKRTDWNEFRLRVDYPFLAGDRHCYLLHDLYDHIHVDPLDIVKIDTFWARVEIDFNYGGPDRKWKNVEEIMEEIEEILRKLDYFEEITREWARGIVLSEHELAPCDYTMGALIELLNNSDFPNYKEIDEYFCVVESGRLKYYGKNSGSRIFKAYKKAFEDFLRRQERLNRLQDFVVYVNWGVQFLYEFKLELLENQEEGN